jgi:hypothetical protein
MKNTTHSTSKLLNMQLIETLPLKRIFITLLFLLGLITTITAQEQYTKPSWWFGAAAGANFNLYEGSTRQLDADLRVPAAFKDGFGTGLYLAPSIEYYRPNTRLGMMLQFGYDSRRGTFDEVMSPCDCPMDLSTELSYFTIEPSLRYAPFKSDFYIYAGPRFAFNKDKSYEYQLKANPNFPNQTDGPVESGEFSEVEKNTNSMQIGAGFDIPLSEQNNGINFSTWVNNGTFNPGTSTVQFITDGTTTVSTLSGSTNFYNVEVVDGSVLEMQSNSTMLVENAIILSGTGKLDTKTNPNTIEFLNGNLNVITTNGETPGYHTLTLSGDFPNLPAELEIYGNLIVNTANVDFANTKIIFDGISTTHQLIQSDVLQSLTLNEVVVIDNNLTSELETLTINDLHLQSGTLRTSSGNTIILDGTVTRVNGYLGGNGTFSFEGPTDLTALFEDKHAEPSIKLNKNEAFLFPDEFHIHGDLILEQGTVNLNTQNLNLGGNISRTAGSVDATSAGLLFFGTQDQTIAADAFLNNTIENITNNGTGGPSLSGELNLTGILDLNSGVFKSNGHLVFKSTLNKTAVMDEVLPGATITGDVTVERFYPARRAFRFLTAPVSSSTSINANWQEGATTATDDPSPGFGTHITGSIAGANGFDATPGGNPSLFRLNNQTQSWTAVANTDQTNIFAGQAYRIMIRGDRSINVTSNSAPPTNTTLRTKGTLVTGTQIDNSMSQGANNFNLIGNPYQAPIDMNVVLAESVNLNAAFYWVWDPTVGGQNPIPGTPGGRGAFVTIDLEDNSNTVDGEGNSTANQYLQPGQAVFVQTLAEDIMETAVIFEETQKDVLQPLTQTFNVISDIKVLLYTADNYAAGNSASDGLRVKFSDYGNNQVNHLDAGKFFNQDENLATLNNGSLLSIESRALPVDGEIVPLFTNQYRSTAYLFELRLKELYGVQAHLRDLYTGDKVALPNNETTLVSFTVNTNIPESIASDRFEIVFEETLLSSPHLNTSANWLLFPNPATNGEVFFTTGNFTSGEVIVEIYNILGQLVHTAKEDIGPNSTLRTDISGLTPGMFITRLTDREGNTHTHKLLVK